ncbi:response regulator [Segetibacter koreensis]|uniref:response regulator n=1 Tax=Segetibacter koreensis TaxID=398037 RepID=UPI000380C33A|nr:response regulator [Segetibacter koreensis]
MPGHKILIIDDDTDDVEILSEAFSQSGVESVYYTHSAMQAFIYLESIENKQDLPKLIVTDLYLPGITGAEFLTDLKKMEKYTHIHVIVLSSNKSASEIERYKQLGALDYLTKPSSYDEYIKVAKNIAEKVQE